jgi:hypothetical protein
MANGCNEKFDLDFLLWIWNYPQRGRRRAFAEVEQLVDKRFILLKHNRDIERFLSELT